MVLFPADVESTAQLLAILRQDMGAFGASSRLDEELRARHQAAWVPEFISDGKRTLRRLRCRKNVSGFKAGYPSL